MKVDNCYELGYVIKAHGLRGEVKAKFDVTDIREYEELESVYLLIEGKLIPFFVESFRITPPAGAIIHFRDVQGPDHPGSLSLLSL